MIKVIMGLKGTGKTKQLVELVRQAVNEETGDVICIEKDKALTYDIPYQARLVHASQYGINSMDLMRGFICGLAAGNFDITHVFIDNLFKMIRPASEEEFSNFLSWLEEFSNSENINFTVTVSAEPGSFGPEITRFVQE